MSHLEITKEGTATREIAEVFDDIKRTMEIPFVPNILKSQGMSESALKGLWGVFSNVFLSTQLPISLAAMILYRIASEHKCEYCSAVHKMTCKTVGMDEETLAALENDLENLRPMRIQKIVAFAEQCAIHPQTITAQDHDQLRAEGISDEEITEIIALAALGNYLDTLADSLQINVDDAFK